MCRLIDSIAQHDLLLQELAKGVEKEVTLPLIILATLQLVRAVGVKIVAEILNERGQATDEARACSKCGQKLESKGLKKREIITLFGVVIWRRRVRGCPDGCEIEQVVPSDEVLGLQAYQRTSLEGRVRLKNFSVTNFVTSS